MIKYFLFIPFVALFFGCASEPSPAPPPPLNLTIAVNEIYCHDTACSCVYDVATRTYSNLQRVLRERDNINLKLVYFSETYQLEDALASGKYDGALCKPWYALRHEKEAGAQFLRIADLLDLNDNRWLSALFIVPTNSPIQTLEQLNGKHLYIGQPDSYEKHYAALRLLKQHQIQPAKIDSNASCSENIGILQDEEADAAVISDYSLYADCAVDFAQPSDFRVLARTEKIPLTSFIVDLNRVSAADAKRLKKALLSLPKNTLLGGRFVEPVSWNPPELEAHP